MNYRVFFSGIVLLLMLTTPTKAQSSVNLPYKTVPNDPLNTRIYTFANGFTLMLSENHSSPRIYTYMPVRVGSNMDPASHTGLAHYLEHMLFKGTTRFGTANWEKEKPLLDKIDSLYDTYNQTKDPAQRKAIYKQIDRVSGEAAKFAIANEYDKMMAAMGTANSNAFTWVEQTVYLEDIPSTALDRFLKLQAERFREPVLRLFHTELEAVYEEKNRSLDSDGNQAFETLMKSLFPTHPYGQKTTIGTVEHLKNPSLKAIREFYQRWYVPNNMALIMVGDFKSDEVAKKVEEAFRSWKPATIPVLNLPKEKPLMQDVVKTVSGPEAEFVMLGFRLPGHDSREAIVARVLERILYNRTAGLIDLNLNLNQRVIDGSAGLEVMKDYSLLYLQANPKSGQTLEKTAALLREPIAKIAKGEFSEELIQAVKRNFKREFQELLESNEARASLLLESFIISNNQNYQEDVKKSEKIESVTREEIMALAKKYLQNAVVVYKKTGKTSRLKVEKPAITPVEVNRNAQSDFVKKVNEIPMGQNQPQFVSPLKDREVVNVGGNRIIIVKNTENSLFEIRYVFPFGRLADKRFDIANEYFKLLDTKQASAQEMRKRLFSLAANLETELQDRQWIIKISGLDETMPTVIELVQNWFTQLKEDKLVLEKLKSDYLQARSDLKQDKRTLMRGMYQYARFGNENPFNYVLNDQEVKALNAEELVGILRNLLRYKHDVWMTSSVTDGKTLEVLKQTHLEKSTEEVDLKNKLFSSVKVETAQTFYCDFDMVQSEIMWVRDLGPFDRDRLGKVEVLNQSFGGGMNSLVFQTLRESKALAYSTYAQYRTPNFPDETAVFQAYIGCQADKFTEAINSMNELLSNLPVEEGGFAIGKASVRSEIENTRLRKMSLIEYLAELERFEMKEDPRERIYNELDQLSANQVMPEFKQELTNHPFKLCILSSKSVLPTEKLKAYGPVTVLKPEMIFGY